MKNRQTKKQVDIKALIEEAFKEQIVFGKLHSAATFCNYCFMKIAPNSQK